MNANQALLIVPRYLLWVTWLQHQPSDRKLAPFSPTRESRLSSPIRAVDVRCAHEEIIRLPNCRRLQPRALRLGLVDMRHQDRNDRPGNLVLNSQDVLQLAVITLGPTNVQQMFR